ncbi:hypothetical protein SAMN04487983_100380 [Streptomyces sp. yr375]|uniref:DUF6980 family protein n=1 Tax=Streptomyces sp. yr375 TaxID=1761906 RepID=UPI0008C50781|nr:hypothetical protein [Streptomyces sp. yr375]SEQ10660.1 hypothetical protein SAMN04487983_100380 [Streptomyces sp. yr375]
MSEHCCDEMTLQAGWRCDAHADVFDCPDALVYYDPRSDDYGLIVHDGGTSCREIGFCPWCGARLGRTGAPGSASRTSPSGGGRR